MAKKRKETPEVSPESTGKPKAGRKSQNRKKVNQVWATFEQCWSACVKNGSPVLMDACRAHLASLGWLDKPEKWIDGMVHFGVMMDDK